MPVAAAALVIASFAAAQDIAGDWHGAIDIENDAPLRLALHVSRAPLGLSATLDSLDEGGADLPLDSISVSSDVVNFKMASVGGTYRGKVAADGSVIVGSWSQNGTDWPLTWYRGEDPGIASRPFDEDQARRQGQAFTQWLYQGKAADLWTRFSPVMRQNLRSPEGLDEYCGRILRGIGKENSLTSEGVSLSGALQVYRRVVKSELSDQVEITFGFDSRGAIAQFEVRAGGNPFRPR